jgi:chemotaxis protein MotA
MPNERTEMLPVLGMVVVFCAVIGGFALENGKFVPLVQPSELVIICGAAIGTLLTANTIHVLKKTLRGLLRVFRGPPMTKELYVSSLVMLYALFDYARRHGATKLEDQIDNPERSVVFRRHAGAIRDMGALNFICDTLRLTSMTVVLPLDLDALLEQDMAVRNREMGSPAETLMTLADALPGLGIIAAVLGVVITMGSITASPKSIGEKVGAALVGTFLGIFLSYGFVAPLGAHLKSIAEADVQYYQVLQAALAAFGKGRPGVIAVEFARRAIPPDLRPEFSEMEAEFRAVAGRTADKVVAIL